MLKEFQEFAFKGTLLDLAIGLILGAAFGQLVASFVTDIVMPPIGLLLGRVDFSNLFINLSDKPYATLEAARAAGAPAIAFGVFLNAVINFVIIALVLFIVIRPFNRAKEKSEEEEHMHEMTEKVHHAMEEQDSGEGGGSESTAPAADSSSATE